MAQPELLWAAAALMLLGVAVSACVRCQLYGKALPWARGPWVAMGGCFPPEVFPLCRVCCWRRGGSGVG